MRAVFVCLFVCLFLTFIYVGQLFLWTAFDHIITLRCAAEFALNQNTVLDSSDEREC